VKRDRQRKRLTWGVVQASQEMGTLSLEISLQRAILAVAGTRDFFRRTMTARSPGVQGKGYLCECDVLPGPAGPVPDRLERPGGGNQKLGVSMREPTCVGDTATVMGKVTKAYRDEKGGGLVDVELVMENPRGTSAQAMATIALP